MGIHGLGDAFVRLTLGQLARYQLALYQVALYQLALYHVALYQLKLPPRMIEDQFDACSTLDPASAPLILRFSLRTFRRTFHAHAVRPIGPDNLL